jgi:radical SAM superfamily enzyme YgiQ (UPF0313 family)
VTGKRSLRVLFFLDYDDGHGGRFSNSPGLLPLIGHARREGFDVDFVSSSDALLDRLTRDAAVDVVAISSMERLLPRSIPVAAHVRELRSDVILMLGGNSIEPFAGDLASTLFDIVAIGECENVFPALLRALALSRARDVPVRPSPHISLPAMARKAGVGEQRGALHEEALRAVLQATFHRHDSDGRVTEIGVSDVWARNAATGDVWVTHGPASAPLATELDPACVMPWDIVDERGWEVMEFYTQRGCRWGRCEFCSVADRNIRALSHDTIIEVLREAPAHGVSTVSFSDDLFVQDAVWTRTLLERIVALDLGLQFRAQTMANRTVWPLLGLMRDAGFVELAFGLETLSPERARFMVKSFDGKRYVANARETVARVAGAGILPVLYMILIDPRSTLIEAATELADAVTLLDSVYERTGVLPKLSFNPVMLPVMGPVMTERFPYRTRTVQCGSRTLAFPFEFELDRPLGLMVRNMAARTDQFPYRRENLGIMGEYLQSAVDAAREVHDPDADLIEQLRAESVDRLARLEQRLTRDICETTDVLRGRCARPEAIPGWPTDERRLSFLRFGGYIDGLVLYRDLLAEDS